MKNRYSFAALTICLCFFISTGFAQQVYLLNKDILQKNKAAYLKKDPDVTARVGVVLKTAAAYLDVTPQSVMDKSFTPSSGTRHDYMSMGPYWWPDPSKPDGLPYIRKDGQRNPEIRKITDREYLGELETRVKFLSLAYYFTGEERYAAKANKLLSVWFTDTATRMNPNLNFGQAIPGLNEGRGIGIIETRLLAYLTDWTGLLSAHKDFTEKKLGAIRQWYSDYLQWLINSKNGKDESLTKNNHGTYYELQVAAFAAFTDNQQQLKKTLAGLMTRMEEQFDEEGKQPLELERTTAYSYSTMNLDGWYSLAGLAERSGADLWNYKNSKGSGLKKAVDWLIPYAMGEKAFTYEQINKYNREDLYHLLLISARKFKDEKYIAALKTFNPTKHTALMDLIYK